MLRAFVVLYLTITVLANPFHKYPYVFLLDVGNEEIEKVNTEQIRLSIPGGSLAVKYPATGEGDLIGHVRVSGVDFGTDLKASIVQGGPGYKYVVLVFMGNPGVEYDAVVTIQTVSDIDDSNKIEDMDLIPEEDDLNNSAEESDEENPNVHREKENIESMQSSSNVYKYSNEEFDIQNEENDADNANDDNINSINEQSIMKEQEYEVKDDNTDQNAVINDETREFSENNHKYNQYGKYEAFRPVIIGGVRFYPQSALYTQDYNNERPDYDQENHASENGNGRQYKDSNNNLADGGSSVEY